LHQADEHLVECGPQRDRNDPAGRDRLWNAMLYRIIKKTRESVMYQAVSQQPVVMTKMGKNARIVPTLAVHPRCVIA
jgi:hypothetical protein